MRKLFDDWPSASLPSALHSKKWAMTYKIWRVMRGALRLDDDMLQEVNSARAPLARKTLRTFSLNGAKKEAE